MKAIDTRGVIALSVINCGRFCGSAEGLFSGARALYM